MKFITIGCIILTKEKINMNPDQNTNKEQLDQTSEQPITPPPSRVDVNSIYPTPGQYRSQQPLDNSTVDNKAKVFNFKGGYSIGGKIFWSLFIAGIIMYVVITGITMSISITHNILLFVIASILLNLFVYPVIIYVIYKVLKSNNIEKPFWLTLFVIATQSAIGAVIAFIITVAMNALFANYNVTSSSLIGIGSIGGVIVGVIIAVGSFIASYFLMKLFWGISFLLYGKIKNKLIIKVICVGFIVIVVCYIAYIILFPLILRLNTANKLSSNYPDNFLKVDKSNKFTYRNDTCDVTAITKQGDEAIIIYYKNSYYQCNKKFVIDKKTKFYKSHSADSPISLDEFITELNQKLTVQKSTYLAVDIRVNESTSTVESVRFRY